VISWIRRLKRSSAFGAMARLASGPFSSEAEPEKLAFLRLRHRALLLIHLEFERVSDESSIILFCF
jgi:hypothetical protein